MKKRLNVLALLYNPLSQSIHSYVKQLDSEKTLADMRHIIDCELVTCTEIEVEGKYYEVWSDDEALLCDKPVPNLYVCDGLIIFGNLLFAKSDDDGETIGLSVEDIRTLKKYSQRQFYKMTHFGKYWR